MDIINKDGYGRDNYFSKEKLETLQNISLQSEAINRQCFIEHQELLQHHVPQNICRYIQIVIDKHIDARLKAAVVTIESGVIEQKKRDAIIQQLRRLCVRVTTRLVIAFDDGVLDCIYQVQAKNDKADLN